MERREEKEVPHTAQTAHMVQAAKTLTVYSHLRLTHPARPRLHSVRREVTRVGVCVDNMYDENHDIAIAMSPSCAEPVLPWLGVFKCLYQCLSPDWEYLYI